MKILLTGASGFLGKKIKKILSEHKIIELGRSSGDVICDLNLETPKLSQVDIVIHAAGKAHFVPKSKDDKKLFYDINVNGTRNLLVALSSSNPKPKYFVFISSVAVYGEICGFSIKEEAELHANDAYGQSKIEAEKIVIDWCNKYNIIWTILRLPLVVGNYPPGNLGAMINGIKNGYYFNIAGGNAKKSMVLASDIAKFILRAAKVGGTYNLTDGIHPTFNELSKKISNDLGKTIIYNMPFFVANILAKFGDLFGNAFPINSFKLNKITTNLTFDDSKARQAFGWDPTPVLKGFKLKKDVQ